MRERQVLIFVSAFGSIWEQIPEGEVKKFTCSRMLCEATMKRRSVSLRTGKFPSVGPFARNNPAEYEIAARLGFPRRLTADPPFAIESNYIPAKIVSGRP